MAQRDDLPSQSVLNAEGRVELGAGTPLAAADAEQVDTTRVSSPSRDAFRRFRRNWAAMISLIVVVSLVFVAVFAPFLHTVSVSIPDYGVLDQDPGKAHWFGTDGIGRDQYSRLLYGLRVPLLVGFIGTIITVLLGALIGVAAGYLGGFADAILSRFTDIMFAFPSFVLALIVVSLYGHNFDQYFGGGGIVILLSCVFAAVSWPPLMRFVRSLALQLREQQFVEAARVSGSSSWSIIRRHLLPNMWGLILVQASFIMVGVISTETVLSIFGLGVQPPNPDLGQMLYDGSQRLDYNAWEVVFPAIAITALILSLTFIGDGVRDAVDPRGNQ